MAKMIPTNPDDFNDSYGESEVFKALQDGLPNDYTVFHSFRWNRKTPFKRVEWGEADFTIFHPLFGILVIEVKSGDITLEKGKWYYKQTKKHEQTPMKDPMEQASRTKFFLVDLLRETLPDQQSCWVDVAVWFPLLNDRDNLSNMPQTYNTKTVLMEWALQNPKQAIENAYGFYNSKNLTNLTKQSAQLVMDTLAPEFRAVQSLSSVYSEQEHTFFRLTNEQNGLLDYLDEQPTAVIQGSAGTGKTLLAVEKAKRLSQDGRVLFLCFNRFLVDELQNNNKAYKDLIAFSNLPIFVKSSTKILGAPDDDSITLYLYDAMDNWQYKHIVIDEGQDFNEEHLELLSAIAKEQKGSFYVFYDEKQLIQRKKIPDCLQNAECRLVLRRNCRNTRKIAMTSGSSIGLEPVLWEKVPEGKIPELHILPTAEEFILKLADLISKYVSGGIPSHQITILTAKTEEKSVLSGRTKFGKHKITSTRNQEDVLFTTIRKFKGLEATVIILIDVNSYAFASPETRNLIYVGTSRAKHFLDILAIADDNELSVMAETITGRKITGSARARQIAATLKVKLSGNK